MVAAKSVVVLWCGLDWWLRQCMKKLLAPKYNDSMADAVADLGQREEIGNAFAGFQKYLYAEKLAQAAH